MSEREEGSEEGKDIETTVKPEKKRKNIQSWRWGGSPKYLPQQFQCPL